MHLSTLNIIAIVVGVLSGVAGVAGFFLGVANFWHQRAATRPRIVVRPRVWSLYDSNTGKLIAKNAGVMEVCNVGQMPVIGSTIGFLRSRRAKQGIIIPKPESLGGVQWGTELKPQQVAMLQFMLEDLPEGRKLGRAFFKTIVGDTFRASRRDMRKFAKERKALGPPPPPA